MLKKEANRTQSIHRIDLSLPVVQTDSYEIFYSPPSLQHLRALSSTQTIIDYTRKPTCPTARIRSPPKLRHLIGPIYVDVYIDNNSVNSESGSQMADNLSNPLTKSDNLSQTLKTNLTSHRNRRKKIIRDETNRSRSSSGDRLLYESFGSFDDNNSSKTRNYTAWQNIHHPQLTTAKTLHLRHTSKQFMDSNNIHTTSPVTKSYENFSQESTIITKTTNNRLYDTIEQLTKTYFPTIQKIRHACPCPDVVTNRMQLKRDQKRNFASVLSGARVAR